MTNKLKIAPAEEPVTLAEIRAQLGITQATDTARDAQITAGITAARQWIESRTGMALITQTWLQYQSCFKDESILIAELQSVSSIAYSDENDVLQTLDPSVYFVDTVNSTVVLANGQSWPTTYNRPNAVIIEYVSGFGLAVDVPQAIKQALMLIVGQWENYQNDLEGAFRVTTVPYAAQQLLATYVDYRVYF